MLLTKQCYEDLSITTKSMKRKNCMLWYIEDVKNYFQMIIEKNNYVGEVQNFAYEGNALWHLQKLVNLETQKIPKRNVNPQKHVLTYGQ